MSTEVKAPKQMKRGGVYEIELDGMDPEGGDKITVASPEGVTVAEEDAGDLERVGSSTWVNKRSHAALTVAVSTLASAKDRVVHITIEDTEGDRTEQDVPIEITAVDASIMGLEREDR